MKKRYVILMAVVLSTLVTGCSNTKNVEELSQSNTVTKESNRLQSGQETDEEIPLEGNTENTSTLIAYFTWADNTVVEDQDAAVQSALDHYESIGDSSNYDGVDAVSSASVVSPGNVEQMANWIQEEIGGDLFSIKVTEPYSSDYDECMERASDERAEDARPSLVEQVDNMDQYDTVMIGYPNWWSGVPMPVLSFIEENDFSGKKIILFCSHGTGGIAGSVREISAVLPDSSTLEENVIGIYRADIPNGQPIIQKWLNEIGY
jgi:flavodoxin